MNDREKCQEIAEAEKGCGKVSFSCEECPLMIEDSKYHCGNFTSSKRAAIAFLEDNKEIQK
jgi:hypothetical protein